MAEDSSCAQGFSLGRPMNMYLWLLRTHRADGWSWSLSLVNEIRGVGHMPVRCAGQSPGWTRNCRGQYSISAPVAASRVSVISYAGLVESQRSWPTGREALAGMGPEATGVSH